MPEKDLSEMTEEELARPTDVYNILATGRPDLQGAGFVLKQAPGLAGNVTLSQSEQTIQELTFDVSSEESILVLFAPTNFLVSTTGTGFVQLAIRNAATGTAHGFCRMAQEAREATVMATGFLTGLAAGTYTFRTRAVKELAGGFGQVIYTSSLGGGTNFIGLLIDR